MVVDAGPAAAGFAGAGAGALADASFVEDIVAFGVAGAGLAVTPLEAFNDGDVHAYFSPYESPYDAYIAYMNALSDLRLRVERMILLWSLIW